MLGDPTQRGGHPARMMPSPAESHPVKSPTTSQDCPRGSRGAGRQRHGGPARADRDQPAWATRRHRTRATQNPGNTKAPSRLPRNGAFLLVDLIASYSNTYAQLRKLRARLSTADMTTSKVGARSRPRTGPDRPGWARGRLARHPTKMFWILDHPRRRGAERHPDGSLAVIPGPSPRAQGRRGGQGRRGLTRRRNPRGPCSSYPPTFLADAPPDTAVLHRDLRSGHGGCGAQP